MNVEVIKEVVWIVLLENVCISLLLKLINRTVLK